VRSRRRSFVNDMVNRAGTPSPTASSKRPASAWLRSRGPTAWSARSSISSRSGARSRPSTAWSAPTPSTPAITRSAGSSIGRPAGWSTCVSRSRTSAARSRASVRRSGKLAPELSELVCGVESTALEADTERLVEKGCRGSSRAASPNCCRPSLLLDVVEIALAEQQPPTDVAALHYALSNRFSVDEMLTKITALPRDDRCRRWPGRRCATTCTQRSRRSLRPS